MQFNTKKPPCLPKEARGIAFLLRTGMRLVVDVFQLLLYKL